MREIDKFEKIIRDKMKGREFQRSEMIGIFKALDLIKEFRKNIPEEINGADEETINRKIAEMFMPDRKNINYKFYGEDQYNDNRKKRKWWYGKTSLAVYRIVVAKQS